MGGMVSRNDLKSDAIDGICVSIAGAVARTAAAVRRLPRLSKSASPPLVAGRAAPAAADLRAVDASAAALAASAAGVVAAPFAAAEAACTCCAVERAASLTLDFPCVVATEAVGRTSVAGFRTSDWPVADLIAADRCNVASESCGNVDFLARFDRLVVRLPESALSRRWNSPCRPSFTEGRGAVECCAVPPVRSAPACSAAAFASVFF